MIRFLCPACKAVLEQPEDKGGEKLPCPKCGQRLQVPTPPPQRNKTILGQSLPEPNAPVATPRPSPSPPVVICPSCNAALAVPAGRGGVFTCPRCKKPVAVPEPLPAGTAVAAPAPAVPVAPTPGGPEERTAAFVCGIISCVMGGVSIVALCPIIIFALPCLSGVALGIIAVALGKTRLAKNLGIIGVSLSGSAVALRILLVLALLTLWGSPSLADWLFRYGR